MFMLTYYDEISTGNFNHRSSYVLHRSILKLHSVNKLLAYYSVLPFKLGKAWLAKFPILGLTSVIATQGSIQDLNHQVTGGLAFDSIKVCDLILNWVTQLLNVQLTVNNDNHIPSLIHIQDHVYQV